MTPTPDRFVPLNSPSFTVSEETAIVAAFRSGWVTAAGKYVDELEARFAALCRRKYAVAVSSGTSALVVALSALGVHAPKRVLMQSYTCEAAAHAVVATTGRPPLCVDVEPETWGMQANPTMEEAQRWDGEGRLWPILAMLERGDLGAVILAHTYGVPSRDTLEVERLCEVRGIPLIEDASEAHGAWIDHRPAGAFGDVSILSCRGEKTVSGGNLGVVLTDDPTIARRAKQWAHNGLPADAVRFWATVPALNHQPSHLNCALACAQLERLDELVDRRQKVHDGWRCRLDGIEGLTFQGEYGRPAWWLTAVLIDRRFTAMLPHDLMTALKARGIETRPGFYPCNLLPHLRDADNPEAPVAEDLLRRMVVLPSGPTLTAADLDYVTEAIMEIVGR